jgi:hypothetical protein
MRLKSFSKLMLLILILGFTLACAADDDENIQKQNELSSISNPGDFCYPDEQKPACELDYLMLVHEDNESCDCRGSVPTGSSINSKQILAGCYEEEVIAFVEGEVIIALMEGCTLDDIRDIAAKYELEVIRDIDKLGVGLLGAPPEYDIFIVICELELNTCIEFAEPNHITTVF